MFVVAPGSRLAASSVHTCCEHARESGLRHHPRQVTSEFALLACSCSAAYSGKAVASSKGFDPVGDRVVAQDAPASNTPRRTALFPLAKFRPTTLPPTLVTRSSLHEQLQAGVGQRLTVVVGSAGAGKSVLLSSWAAARQPAVTSWLSCDEADANPVRFWTGFIEAPRAVAPGFGADAADLLAMDGAMS